MINSRFSIYFGVNMIVPSNNLGNVFSAFQKNETPDQATIAQAEDELMQAMLAEEHPQKTHTLMQQVNQSLQYPETADKAAWHLASRIKRAEARPQNQPDYVPGLCVERTFISALKTLFRQASTETDEVKLFRENIQALCARIEAVKADPAKLSPFPSLPRELMAYICAMANLKHTGVCKDIDQGIVQWVVELINTQHLDLVQDLGFTSLEQIMNFFGDQFSKIKHISIMGLHKICAFNWRTETSDSDATACFDRFIVSLKCLESFKFIYRNIDVDVYLTYPQWEIFSSNNNKLKELTVSCSSIPITCMQRFSDLKSLEIMNMKSAAFFELINLNNLKTVEKLTFDNRRELPINFPLSGLPKLKKLNIRVRSDIINEEKLLLFFNQITHRCLEELSFCDLNVKSKISYETLDLPRLKKLNFYNCYVRLFPAKKAIDSSSIEEIGCYGCTYNDDASLFDEFYFACKQLNKLKKIDFLGCKTVRVGNKTPSECVHYLKKNKQPHIALHCDAIQSSFQNDSRDSVPEIQKYYENRSARAKEAKDNNDAEDLKDTNTV
jgi:hypothetical protein